MPIRIENIAVQGLGPISNFNEKFSGVTLVYGRNEVGKTLLVEYILKTLFDHPKGFEFRDNSPNGTIEVSGISNEVIKFTSRTRQKIDNYFAEMGAFPANVANLLVVKGGRSEFEGMGKQGISDKFVKSLFAGKTVSDEILEKIPATVKDAIYENGEIIGASRGLIKKREELISRLEQLNSLNRMSK